MCPYSSGHSVFPILFKEPPLISNATLPETRLPWQQSPSINLSMFSSVRNNALLNSGPSVGDLAFFFFFRLFYSSLGRCTLTFLWLHFPPLRSTKRPVFFVFFFSLPYIHLPLLLCERATPFFPVSRQQDRLGEIPVGIAQESRVFATL